MSSTSKTLQSCDFIKLCSSHDAYPQSTGDGLDLLRVDTPFCHATIALQGAQLLEFTPKGGESLLWLSPKCHFQLGKSLRGGVPICLPWFGDHPTDPGKPSHGFARTSEWTLDTANLDSERCELVFSLIHEANELFPFDFTARLTMRLNQKVEIILELHNTGSAAFDTSWAMHSYFNISDLDKVSVGGLENLQYADKVQNYSNFTQSSALTFTGEVDRVFEDVDTFLDINSEPSIHIEHYNCPSVIVWNPGAELASRMSDVGEGNERNYICVERGAARGDTWTLEPLEHRSAWIRLSNINT